MSRLAMAELLAGVFPALPRKPSCPILCGFTSHSHACLYSRGTRGVIDLSTLHKETRIMLWKGLFQPARVKSNSRCRKRWLPGVERLEDRIQPDASPLSQIDHFVVIYQENWSFDGLYGSFPGANGIANASSTSLTQVDRVTGSPLATSLPIYPGQSND